jgi:membrane-bound metal-dependent hydrolase YbcI (DUF457 family)
MFLGHFAVGLAVRRHTPAVSLGTWFVSVQLVDLLWPLFLLAGIEHVRIAPGITAFTPLDFYDYPITHSLIGGLGWAVLLGAAAAVTYKDGRVALLLAAGVLSHWILDVISHRPDMPVLPHGPYVGLGLWNSIPLTLVVELTLFFGGVYLYAAGHRTGRAFWALVIALLVAYFGAAFGPPPPDVRTLAFSALAMWLFIAWGKWTDGNSERRTKN